MLFRDSNKLGSIRAKCIMLISHRNMRACKKCLLVIPVFLFAGFSTLFSQTYPTDPDKAEIVYSDIGLFWSAFDRLKVDESKNPFQENYLQKGTIGLRDF